MRWLVWASLLVGCGRISFESTGGILDDGGGGGDGVGDGASDTVNPPIVANVVFVSSPQSALLQNVAAYNAVCRSEAQGRGLPGTFVAYLSNSGEGSAAQRIAGARGFQRIDGHVLADQPTEIAVKLRRPVLYTVDGTPVPSTDGVMTGSDITGNEVGNCNGFSLGTGVIESGFADGTLGEFGSSGATTCSVMHRVYCFQIDLAVPITEVPATGRRAFVTTTTTTLTGGIAQADARCTTAATAGGLTGTFRALIADNGASAASRFSAAGANWVRIDGVEIAATPTDFLAGNWLAPINTRADGTLSNVAVFFGADDLDSPGTAASTCTGWTVMDATMPTVGTSASNPPRAFHDPGRTNTCTGGARLYCIEP